LTTVSLCTEGGRFHHIAPAPRASDGELALAYAPQYVDAIATYRQALAYWQRWQAQAE